MVVRCLLVKTAAALQMMANSVLDHTYGGQTLHIVFLVERLLHNIMSRGARYEVVFFDCHAAIWECNPLGALLREVLFCHLQHACETKVHCFPNYWCEEWETFLAETKPGICTAHHHVQNVQQAGDKRWAHVWGPVSLKCSRLHMGHTHHTYTDRPMAMTNWPKHIP